MSRPCVTRILKVTRQRIAGFYENKKSFDAGEIEIDESYFGARLVRGVKVVVLVLGISKTPIKSS
ncbi:hypothetical protein AAEX28_06345 [Lentisphaerota bacterium WC36G]|nr:hypothetical protein LJT99_09210 [Lentisphaerae bacterium WC36]